MVILASKISSSSKEGSKINPLPIFTKVDKANLSLIGKSMVSSSDNTTSSSMYSATGNLVFIKAAITARLDASNKFPS